MDCSAEVVDASSVDNASSAVRSMEQIREDDLVGFILNDVGSLDYVLTILGERIEMNCYRGMSIVVMSNVVEGEICLSIQLLSVVDISRN